MATIIARKPGTGSVISKLESLELYCIILFKLFFRVSCFNTEFRKVCLVVLVI